MRLTIEQLIAKYQLEKQSWNTDKNEIYRQSGAVSSSYKLDKQLPESFSPVEGWEDCDYRVIWVSDEERAIATYCEGDFSLNISHSVEEYKRQIQEAHNFYVAEGGIDCFTLIPEEQPIAQQAIEEIPGINEQKWRQYHLFSRRTYSWEDAIISHPEKSVVLAKAAKLMMTKPEDVNDYEFRHLSFFFSYMGGGSHFNRHGLYNVLTCHLPEYFTNINEPNTHIELKNWIWRYFSGTCSGFKDLLWLQPYKHRGELIMKNWNQGKREEHFNSLFDYLFDVWELETEGAIKITHPYRVRVSYYLAGQQFQYEGKIVAYRYKSKRSTRNPNISAKAHKEYIVQPDEQFPESCGYLVYWLKRSSFTILTTN